MLAMGLSATCLRAGFFLRFLVTNGDSHILELNSVQFLCWNRKNIAFTPCTFLLMCSQLIWSSALRHDFYNVLYPLPRETMDLLLEYCFNILAKILSRDH